MRKSGIILAAFWGSILLFCGTARAISIRALPAAGTVGDAVTFTVEVAYAVTPGAPCIEINFGDGSPAQALGIGTCSVFTCRISTRHVYARAGTYTVTVRSRGCSEPVVPPDPVRMTIQIALPPATVLSPKTLPDGIVGIAYRQQLNIPGGQGNLMTYSLEDGSLPPGLALGHQGLISGTPTKLGKYRFTVRTTDRNGFATDQLYYLTVRQATFTVKASPTTFRTARYHATPLTVRYRFSSPDPITTTLRSPRGEFFVNPQVGAINKPLVVHMINGQATASEHITIPASVSRRAEALHAATVRYSRTFTSSVMQPRTATVKISFVLEGAAQLRVTRIKIYFNNGRPKITVKRNQRDLRISADVRYEGTGLLEGYFEVDGRILQRVQKHVIYGRSAGFNTATFRTPTAKVLPTFAPGTHIARFVITRPAQNIPFPSAVYFVSAQNAIRLAHILLKAPENGAQLAFSPTTFSWQRSDRYTTYRIAFAGNALLVKGSIPEPFFSALRKTGSYSLPKIVVRTRFSPDRQYRWRVIGFDAEHNTAGRSSWRRFSFAQPEAYVPGQILIVTPTTPQGQKQIEAIAKKFRLRLLHVYDIETLGQKMAVFHTDGAVPETVAAIAKQGGIVAVQPNYIFRTLSDPMGSMQSLQRILHLAKLHQACTGRGVTVAVVDTGVDIHHRDLQGRIAAHANFIANSDYRAEIHGTAVAGIIAAAVNGFGIEGVAPRARILACRACRQLSPQDPEGECYTTAIARALDMALTSAVRVVNMSFGAAVADGLLVKLIHTGAARGILFVAPVGNRADQKDLVFPAADKDVLAVAGVAEDGRLLPNAAIAAKADACAPVFHVLTTVPGNKYNFMSGTSISSAVIAGLLADAGEKNPFLQKGALPARDTDVCRWTESLLTISLCRK